MWMTRVATVSWVAVVEAKEETRGGCERQYIHFTPPLRSDSPKSGAG